MSVNFSVKCPTCLKKLEVTSVKQHQESTSRSKVYYAISAIDQCTSNPEARRCLVIFVKLKL